MPDENEKEVDETKEEEEEREANLNPRTQYDAEDLDGLVFEPPPEAKDQQPTGQTGEK